MLLKAVLPRPKAPEGSADTYGDLLPTMIIATAQTLGTKAGWSFWWWRSLLFHADN